MDVEDHQRFLNEARRMIGEVDRWADGKIASVAPLSPAEEATLENMKVLLHELKQCLLDMKK